MNYRDSDIKRLLNTLFFIPTDRTPNFELLIERKQMDHILDKKTDMRNWDISPEDNLEYAQRSAILRQRLLKISLFLVNPTLIGLKKVVKCH